MRVLRWVLLLAVTGCVGEITGPGSSNDDPPGDDVDEPLARGLVLEPKHGSLVERDPLSTTFHVTGRYDGADELAVQILSNPADLTSWITIAHATPKNGAFAVDIEPITSEADRTRWPRGGIFRLRVVDARGNALPHEEEAPESTVIALAESRRAPRTWTYLVENAAPGSLEETREYYATIDAPATLDAFLQRYGFPGDETQALYYNRGDLKIGRDMHCRAIETPAGGIACYVRNYGEFGGSKNQALQQATGGGIPLATVAMVYAPPITAPNAVTFMVYGGNGARIDEAQLDTQGDNTSIPQNCINCHGGRSSYDPATNSVTNARFLPFDPLAFDFSTQPQFTLAQQVDDFRALNKLVGLAAAPAGMQELIDGMFPANIAYDPLFVPAGWRASPRDARVYHGVIAPYCRSCHTSFEDSATFATAVKSRAGLIVEKVCGAGPKGMPTAEATTDDFYRSPARAVLLTWLDAPGACAPAQ
jgi:hypothetical protein